MVEKVWNPDADVLLRHHGKLVILGKYHLDFNVIIPLKKWQPSLLVPVEIREIQEWTGYIILFEKIIIRTDLAS